MRRRLALLPALLLAGGSLALAARAPAFTVRRETLVVDGQKTLLQIPSTFDGRLVLYAHSFGHTDTEPELFPLSEDSDALLSAGYLIASSAGHGNNWGDPVSLQDQVSLWSYVTGRYDVSSTFVMGASMGGLDSLEVLPLLRNVRAYAGIYPVCNLSSMLPGVLGSAVVSTYGSASAAEAAPLSPVPFGREAAGLPMIFWSSPGDTVVPRKSNTDVCAAEARRAGAHVTVVTTRGEHGDVSNFQPARLLAFFNGAS